MTLKSKVLSFLGGWHKASQSEDKEVVTMDMSVGEESLRITLQSLSLLFKLSKERH